MAKKKPRPRTIPSPPPDAPPFAPPSGALPEPEAPAEAPEPAPVVEEAPPPAETRKRGFWCPDCGKVPAEQVNRATMVHKGTAQAPCGCVVDLVGAPTPALAMEQIGRLERDLTAARALNQRLAKQIADMKKTKTASPLEQ